VGTIVAIRLASIDFPQSTGTVDPHVNLPLNQAEQVANRQKQLGASAFIAVTEGEVAHTEERIREASALATAASLFAANELLNGRKPLSVGVLLSSLNAMGLMPPGVQLVNAGELNSSHARLFVRYQAEPLSVEVVSLGKVRIDGPALLVRVPNTSLSGFGEDGAGLYLAPRLDEIALPAPFASEAEVIALGFVPEPLRAAKLPKP